MSLIHFKSWSCCSLKKATLFFIFAFLDIAASLIISYLVFKLAWSSVATSISLLTMSLTNEKPEKYVIFEVNHDGVFNLHPLSTPRSSLEEGLTIVEDDFDMNKMYDMVSDELGLHDNWLYEGLSLDGPIDVGGPSIYVDETVVCDGHSLPDIQKECFANSISLDSVGANVQVVLKKKKGRSMVKLKVKGRLGSLGCMKIIVDDDPQLKSQV
ncbi:hypothetical protein Tco_0769510 [Tanacetum coccineum]|uniref:Uncharacterized protein n=1 Tax=Tanacetum coccineum TaxID=301880 RepID=A0ABQ4Z9L2_9ASTR